jgi:hypothetical protein
MKDGVALIQKIWSDLREKECYRRIVNVEREVEGMETKFMEIEKK